MKLDRRTGMGMTGDREQLDRLTKKVVVELKAVKALDPVHLAQCLNYLRATGLRLCLLMNFGRPKVEIRRVVNRF
ncbi:MAG: GxxExxY protein [Planctomycetota bacterium]